MDKSKENFCGLMKPCAGDIGEWCDGCEYLNKLLNQKEASVSVPFNGVLCGSITVPRDPRTRKAQVTSEMKKMCIGEFTFMRDSHHDEFGDGVVETIEVPWTTVKEIYKAMVESAERTAA
ncbi:hypothetical protein KAR91_33285 [Candidatus Pacearchaeota archaeon]|nr:hypothetical protein [Candidatus Pacearchaeota archaeon]